MKLIKNKVKIISLSVMLLFIISHISRVSSLSLKKLEGEVVAVTDKVEKSEAEKSEVEKSEADKTDTDRRRKSHKKTNKAANQAQAQTYTGTLTPPKQQGPLFNHTNNTLSKSLYQDL